MPRDRLDTEIAPWLESLGWRPARIRSLLALYKDSQIEEETDKEFLLVAAPGWFEGIVGQDA